MARLDDLAVNNGLAIRQMMELAGWHMLAIFRRLSVAKSKKIVIVVGKGNKGGDGLSAARHLLNHGWSNVTIILLANKLSADATHHYQLLKRMGADLIAFRTPKTNKVLAKANIIIDSLIGYNLRGAPRGDFAKAIDLMNAANKPTIAYDMPSGIDATTGQCYKPCVKATATLTLALPKQLFKKPVAKKLSGKVFVGDIGIPTLLYDKIRPGSRPKFEKTRDHLIKV